MMTDFLALATSFAQRHSQPRENHLVAATATALAYLAAVHLLRYSRRNKIIRKYGRRGEQSLASMTVEDASDIRKQLANLEFPHAFTTSLFFALFKTYAIPSISKLLLATGQLASNETACKRAADTAALLTEMTNNSPRSDRAVGSVARMNYLHGRYRKAGRISNDDMLYTLSLFALEPSRWIKRFEWREFSEVELCAEGVFWRDAGEAMEISYEGLEQYLDGDDGLAWLRAIEIWSDNYARVNAVPDETNEKVAKGTLDILLFGVPGFAKGVAVQAISSIIDWRTREAMLLSPPTPSQQAMLNGFMALRSFAIKHLFLPRPAWLEFKRVGDDPDPRTGKYNMLLYFSQPWYIKPTFANRWGVGPLFTRLCGGLVPGAPQFRPEGYTIEDVGPVNMEGKGRPEMELEAKRLRARPVVWGGCPVPGQ